MKRLIAILLLLFALLGFSRTPEAQVEGVTLGIVAPVVVAAAVGGCAHMGVRSSMSPATAPAPPAQTGG